MHGDTVDASYGYTRGYRGAHDTRITGQTCSLAIDNYECYGLPSSLLHTPGILVR